MFFKCFPLPDPAVCVCMNRKKKVLLVFDGVDTVASIWLNGIAVGETDNMFRRYVCLLENEHNVLMSVYDLFDIDTIYLCWTGLPSHRPAEGRRKHAESSHSVSSSLRIRATQSSFCLQSSSWMSSRCPEGGMSCQFHQESKPWKKIPVGETFCFRCVHLKCSLCSGEGAKVLQLGLGAFVPLHGAVEGSSTGGVWCPAAHPGVLCASLQYVVLFNPLTRNPVPLYHRGLPAEWPWSWIYTSETVQTEE